MMQLARLQRAFQAEVLQGKPSASSSRMQIYLNAYVSRLIEALASNYPMLRVAMGDEFATWMREYVEGRPSHTRSIRWYGAGLAAHLSKQGQSALADLARLEWQLAYAFDAQDAAVLDAAALECVEPQRWEQLQFRLHPSVSAIVLHSNAGTVAQAHFAGEALPPLHADSSTEWLIWRSGLSTHLRQLEAAEAAGFAVLAAGGTFGELCAALCEQMPEEHVPLAAASHLKTWLSAGLFRE